MLYSKGVDDSLHFVNISDEYSEGVWSFLYWLTLYFFIFHEFNLSGFITSKEIEWKKLSDRDLAKIVKRIIVDIDGFNEPKVEFAAEKLNVKILDLVSSIELQLIYFGEDLFIKGNTIQAEHCKYHFVLFGINVSTSDERIVEEFKWLNDYFVEKYGDVWNAKS